jgi:hypothetical protein
MYVRRRAYWCVGYGQTIVMGIPKDVVKLIEQIGNPRPFRTRQLVDRVLDLIFQMLLRFLQNFIWSTIAVSHSHHERLLFTSHVDSDVEDWGIGYW